MLKRIFSLFSANVMGQGINMFLRIISMPVFLHFWGKELYGEWLILITIPSYLAVSGTGICNVAGNEMVIKKSNGSEKDVLGIYQSIWLLILIVAILFLFISIALAFFLPIKEMLHLKMISADDIATSIVLLAVYTLWFLQSELLLGAYRAAGIFVKGINFNNLILLTENIGLLLVVMFSSSVTSAISVYVLIRMAGVTLMYIMLRKRERWFGLGIKYASFSTIKQSVSPTLSYLAINVSNAISVQGMITIIGLRLGASAVVSFSVMRTILNSVKQLNSLIYYSVWPEFSTALAINNTALAKRLHRYACQSTFLFTLFNVVILLIFGSQIIQLWTNGKVEIDYPFFLFMLLSMLPNTFYVTSSFVNVSINKMTKIAVVCICGAFISLFVTYILLPYVGISAVPLVQMAVDVILLFIIVRDALIIVQDKTIDFIQSMVSFDYLKIMKQVPKSLLK